MPGGLGAAGVVAGWPWLLDEQADDPPMARVLVLPFMTMVLGVEVTVEGIDLMDCESRPSASAG
jgi:hypothetical protein